MIINLDDIKYMLLRHGKRLFRNIKIELYKNAEDVFRDKRHLLIMHYTCTCIMQSRLLDLETYLAPSDTYYSARQLYPNPWPEMEETIRRDCDYKLWYEEEAGIRI